MISLWYRASFGQQPVRPGHPVAPELLVTISFFGQGRGDEPGDSAKARKRTSRYTDHSGSPSTRTVISVISVMVHFVSLR